MRVLKALLRPNWTKVFVALLLFALFLSAQVQGYAFSQFGPKPRLYDLLSPLALWPAAVMIFGPIHALMKAVDVLPPQPLYYVASAVYSLILGWVFVFAHQRGGFRIYRPGRLALPLIPIAVVFVLAHTWPESNALSGVSLAVSGVVFSAAMLAGYLYLVFCLVRGLGRSAWWTARWGRARL